MTTVPRLASQPNPTLLRLDDGWYVEADFADGVRYRIGPYARKGEALWIVTQMMWG